MLTIRYSDCILHLFYTNKGFNDGFYKILQQDVEPTPIFYGINTFQNTVLIHLVFTNCIDG